MTARDDVLGRIRSALGPNRPVPAEIARNYRLIDNRPITELLDVLVDRIEDYRATVVRCAPEEVATAVQRLLAGSLGSTTPPTSSSPPVYPFRGGLRAVLRTTTGPRWSSPRAAAVTGVAVAIAETGTLVLDGSPPTGRRALSLLPDCLVCVVTSNQVVGNVPEALSRLDPLRPLTMISGPSATSDIELQRVEGVHGPRTLLVVLTD